MTRATLFGVQPDLKAVQAAHQLLRGVATVTPLEGSRPLSEAVGGPVHLKCENLQRTGSFKIRGAFVRISRLSPAELGRGVVAASAGNHAQGVALASSIVGTRAVVFMPGGAPLPKVKATQDYGAEVRLHGETVDEALVAARAFSDETGATLVHPFDHPDVIAGQGTVGLEILEQCPDVRTVVVCTGGGGLLSGIAVAIKGLRPDVKVVGVQAAAAAAWPGALAAGHPVPLPSMATMADGIAVGRPGDLTYEIVSTLADGIRTVSEESLSRAVLLCLERAKLLVEPAGAAGVAAVQDHPGDFEPPVVVVLSGGNVDALLLTKLLRHGLVAAARYLSVQVAIPDVPGSLARLLEVLATTEVNVLDVEHQRTTAQLHLDEVVVRLELETRGPGHSDQVLAALGAAGLRVRS